MECIYIPDDDNLNLRYLTRRKEQVSGNITRIKNRIKGHLYFRSLKFISWAGGSLKIMESDAAKRFDFALLSALRELRFLREERIRIIHAEHEWLKRLNRENVQKNLESIPGIGFDTAVVLQAELWDMKRFKDKEYLNSLWGLLRILSGAVNTKR